MVRLCSSVFLSAPAALQQTFDDFPWHLVLFRALRWASALPSLWSGKWVAQIGAFYCNGRILRANESEGTGLLFLPCLPHHHRLSEK